MHTATKRDNTPRISGSLGGFIAIIIFLSLVIIASCIGIFFLLRERTASDEEQARRGKRNRYANASRSTANRRPLARLAAMFGRADPQERTRPQNISRGNTKGGGAHGWIQAGSTDDWEADMSVGVAGPSGVRDIGSSSPSLSLRTTRPPSPPPVSRSTSDSTTSVRFDLHAVRGLQYPERLSSQSTLPNIHSQLSSPSYSPAPSFVPLRTLSPEPIREESSLDGDSRQYTTPSGVVMRTLPGGSKFIEAL
ncbi:hypothetical protein FPV67DRAFT_1673339 [Lyophyllum atratum]|nr:hypothetical protein FPV67DRAFT_1673339 [Lyophyllum atratum]